jgi:DNA-binding transcriptional regulator YiaG
MLMTKRSRKSPSPDAERWAARLKKLRTRLGLSQVKAAERAGVRPRTWIAWENRQRTPGRLALALLKVAFPGEF